MVLLVDEGIGQKVYASCLMPVKSEGTVKHHSAAHVSDSYEQEARELGKKGKDSWSCGREVWWADTDLDNLGGVLICDKGTLWVRGWLLITFLFCIIKWSEMPIFFPEWFFNSNIMA